MNVWVSKWVRRMQVGRKKTGRPSRRWGDCVKEEIEVCVHDALEREEELGVAKKGVVNRWG